MSPTLFLGGSCISAIGQAVSSMIFCSSMLGTVDLWQFREIILLVFPSFCRVVPLSGWLIREGTCPEVGFVLPFVGFFVFLLSAVSFIFFVGLGFRSNYGAPFWSYYVKPFSKEDGSRRLSFERQQRRKEQNKVPSLVSSAQLCT